MNQESGMDLDWIWIWSLTIILRNVFYDSLIAEYLIKKGDKFKSKIY